jgi:hypothetical protein
VFAVNVQLNLYLRYNKGESYGRVIVAVYLLAVSVGLLLVLPSTEGAMQGQGELPNLPFYKVEVDASDKTTNDALRRMGATELSRAGYDYLRLWSIVAQWYDTLKPGHH